MKVKKSKPFASEADLCAAFIEALPGGWIAYAETEGWDILLVRRSDGFQIGVEAKLKFTAKLLQQALEQSRWSVTGAGPDCRAVLVPQGETDLGPIAKYIGVVVIEFCRGYFNPRLPVNSYVSDDWPEWLPKKRHKLPEYVPDVAAGSSAPVQLTPWKIQAIKLVILAERRGYVTRDDFRSLGIDHRRWISSGGWLRPADRNGWYVVEGAPPFCLREQHPRVFAEIEADAEKWMPKEAA